MSKNEQNGESTIRKRIVVYIDSPEYRRICSLLPSNEQRSDTVGLLVDAYGLLCGKKDGLVVVPPVKAQAHHLMAFHSRAYTSALLDFETLGDDDRGQTANSCSSSSSSDEEEQEEENDKYNKKITDLAKYGLEYDCPLFPRIGEYIQYIAGASLMGARYLVQARTSQDQVVAINWNGGRHHAKKAHASGFCYVNDIVLAILELRKSYDKVMYIDLDLHHGDGVEGAFAYSNRVLTLSVHRQDQFVFPFGTSGQVQNVGNGYGKYFNINIPLRSGASDETLERVYKSAILPAFYRFNPDCIVVQCGSDGLARDPCNEFNLSIEGIANVVDGILKWGRPTLLLGGGGYNHADTARLCTLITARTLAVKSNVFSDLYCASFHDDNMIPLDSNTPYPLAQLFEKDHMQFWIQDFKSRARKDENLLLVNSEKLLSQAQFDLDLHCNDDKNQTSYLDILLNGVKSNIAKMPVTPC